MIGLSIDALKPELLQKMGRCTKNNEILTPTRCISLCKSIKENDMQLKINTVVSKLNLQENFIDFIQTVCPDRWKILKMKGFSNGKIDNYKLEIPEDDFNRFCSLYTSIPHIKETSLKNTYIMIDSGGRLVDNSTEQYKPIANLLQKSFSEAFKDLPFEEALYESRYNNIGNNSRERVSFI